MTGKLVMHNGTINKMVNRKNIEHFVGEVKINSYKMHDP
jgi:hypothetical protein